MGLGFYFNDLYPNQNSGVNTRTQTIPEAEDKAMLADEGTKNVNTSVTPTKRKHIYIALAVIVALIVLFGSGK